MRLTLVHPAPPIALRTDINADHDGDSTVRGRNRTEKSRPAVVVNALRP